MSEQQLSEAIKVGGGTPVTIYVSSSATIVRSLLHAEDQTGKQCPSFSNNAASMDAFLKKVEDVWHSAVTPAAGSGESTSAEEQNFSVTDLHSVLHSSLVEPLNEALARRREKMEKELASLVSKNIADKAATEEQQGDIGAEDGGTEPTISADDAATQRLQKDIARRIGELEIRIGAAYFLVPNATPTCTGAKTESNFPPLPLRLDKVPIQNYLNRCFKKPTTLEAKMNISLKNMGEKCHVGVYLIETSLQKETPEAVFGASRAAAELPDIRELGGRGGRGMRGGPRGMGRGMYQTRGGRGGRGGILAEMLFTDDDDDEDFGGLFGTDTDEESDGWMPASSRGRGRGRGGPPPRGRGDSRGRGRGGRGRGEPMVW